MVPPSSLLQPQSVSTEVSVYKKHLVDCLLLLLLGPPSAPRNIELISAVDDPRSGFLGHAVIAIQWDPPEESKYTMLSLIHLHTQCGVF